VKQLAALYRSQIYSPNQHRCNDTAIMDAVVARLAALGWAVQGTTERAVEQGDVPSADCYLNMCQGPKASDQLVEAELGEAIVVNRPEAVLNCHRHRLVPAIRRAGLPFPATMLLDTDAVPMARIGALATTPDAPIWIKRGDVHATTKEDVVAARADQVARAVRAFAERGVRTVALQAHVPGPIVKFYGVASANGPATRFFHWYVADDPTGSERSDIDGGRLRELAFLAAEALGLGVFGGDAAFPRGDEPVLIDLNDWPSFAPVRDDAADAIATYVHQLATISR
jgi:hypothetical protein